MRNMLFEESNTWVQLMLQSTGRQEQYRTSEKSCTDMQTLSKYLCSWGKLEELHHSSKSLHCTWFLNFKWIPWASFKKEKQGKTVCNDIFPSLWLPSRTLIYGMLILLQTLHVLWSWHSIILILEALHFGSPLHGNFC